MTMSCNSYSIKDGIRILKIIMTIKSVTFQQVYEKSENTFKPNNLQYGGVNLTDAGSQ